MPGMQPRRLRILVVDDEGSVRRTLRSIIEAGGHEVVEADGVRTGLKALTVSPPDVALVDHHLADGDAGDLLRALPHAAPALPVVVLTGDASIELAVATIRGGAHNFLVKPPDSARLLRVLESAAASREALGAMDPFGGESAVIRELAQRAARSVEGSAPVLLEGETGSGKCTIARWIHARSVRAAHPFIDLSAAEGTPAALEAELFGSETSGAARSSRRNPGLIEQAFGGSLFIDEIADLEPSLQSRLARVIEENRLRRPGGLTSVAVDVRLFAATSKDLRKLVGGGLFRPDLFYRIGAAPIRVPPLRERLEDLPELVRRMLEAFGPARERGVSFTQGAMAALARHAWAGNVRELRQVVERAVLAATGSEVRESDLALAAPTADGPPRTLAEVERAHIARTLEEHRFHVGDAARALGVPRSTLYDTIKKLGIALPARRES